MNLPSKTISGLRFRSARLRRLGVVVSPVVCWMAYEFTAWPIQPDQHHFCSVTSVYELISVHGVATGRDNDRCAAAYNQLINKEPPPRPMFEDYRGMVLYNVASFDGPAYAAASSFFRKERDDELKSYYTELAFKWATVLLASTAALGALWSVLVAADWVLRA
jgi:hypothetical protein